MDQPSSQSAADASIRTLARIPLRNGRPGWGLARVMRTGKRWAMRTQSTVGVTLGTPDEPRSPRSQMKRADRTGAAYVLIIGSDELARGEISVKTMATGEQETVARDQIVARLRGTQKDYVKT